MWPWDRIPWRHKGGHHGHSQDLDRRRPVRRRPERRHLDLDHREGAGAQAPEPEQGRTPHLPHQRRDLRGQARLQRVLPQPMDHHPPEKRYSSGVARHRERLGLEWIGERNFR